MPNKRSDTDPRPDLDHDHTFNHSTHSIETESLATTQFYDMMKIPKDDGNGTNGIPCTRSQNTRQFNNGLNAIPSTAWPQGRFINRFTFNRIPTELK